MLYLWLNLTNHNHKTLNQLSKHYSYELTLGRLNVLNMALQTYSKPRKLLSGKRLPPHTQHLSLVAGSFCLSPDHFQHILTSAISLWGRQEKMVSWP